MIKTFGGNNACHVARYPEEAESATSGIEHWDQA
jgi:hypothetical protein